MFRPFFNIFPTFFQRCHFLYSKEFLFFQHPPKLKKTHHRSIHNIRLQMIIDNQVFEFSNTCTVRASMVVVSNITYDPSPPATGVRSKIDPRGKVTHGSFQGRRKVGDRGDMSPPLFIQGGTTYRLSPPLFRVTSQPLEPRHPGTTPNHELVSLDPTATDRPT